MSTNMAFSPCSMFLTFPLKILPTMFRSVSRSILYSSSTPSSRSATRRSSFSQLMTIWLPVLRLDRPRNCLTLSSMIELEKVGVERLEEQKVMFLLLLLRRLLTLGILLWLSPEKIEKAVPFFGGRLSPRSDAVVICVRTYIRLSDFGPGGFGMFRFFVNRGVV